LSVVLVWLDRTLNGADVSVERCRELTRTLEATLSWMRAARQRMRHQQSLGGDLLSLQQQADELAVRSGGTTSRELERW